MKHYLKTLFASFLTVAVTALVFSTTFQAQGQGQGQQGAPPEAEGKTVVEVVETKEKTNAFSQLLKDSGFERILKRQGTFTVIAPKNEAVEQAGQQAQENPQQIVQGHLYQGEVSKDQVEEQTGVTVEETDESVSSGVVFIVDGLASQQ